MAGALVLGILEEHVDEAAFLWALRDAAATAPHYDRPALGELDERLDAHLDGLRVGGAEGLRLAGEALDAGDPGTVFTAAVLAVERGDGARTEAALAAAAGDPAAGRALVSAMAWIPSEGARGVIAPLIATLIAASAPAARRRLGIAALAARREDPGEALAYAIFGDDRRLKARALRAAGELGRADLLDAVRAEARGEGDEPGYWARWSAALLGDEAAPELLWSIAAAGGPFTERACAAAVRRLDPREARRRLEGLGASPEHARTAVIGAGALGDPALVAWLLEAMRAPALARRAGEAFTAITGAAIEGPLAGAAPEGFTAGPSDRPEDTAVAMDPDGPLPWPSPAGAAAFWSAHERGFHRGARYLRGAPMSEEALARELAKGTQRRRAAAALELGLRRPGRPLPEVRARVTSSR